MELRRGRIYLAKLETDEPKYWLVVSNNQRNRAFRDALAVRITSTNKFTELDSVVPLPTGEILTGWVRCDSLTTMYEDEPIKDVGGLSPAAMRAVESGLRAALGMQP
ncbi:MAG: type II toxin-antitoxin system PemK/MazF family toxin [Gulosibacter sp.]|uniref:type II toxin-antitoxin system PemK/MazF family toxin n=1 Tax=Gulosibacter sp. TaxID=2817531 RepID=UPI003F913DF6